VATSVGDEPDLKLTGHAVGSAPSGDCTREACRRACAPGSGDPAAEPFSNIAEDGAADCG
jgi:hypothetical protein